MPPFFKIVSSRLNYDPDHAIQVRHLHFTEYNNAAKGNEIAGRNFYYLNELLNINISVEKKDKLAKAKPGTVVELFSTSRNSKYYAVRLTEQEEKDVQELIKIESEIEQLDVQIKEKVGDLLERKKQYEKQIKSLLESFE